MYFSLPIDLGIDDSNVSEDEIKEAIQEYLYMNYHDLYSNYWVKSIDVDRYGKSVRADIHWANNDEDLEECNNITKLRESIKRKFKQRMYESRKKTIKESNNDKGIRKHFGSCSDEFMNFVEKVGNELKDYGLDEDGKYDGIMILSDLTNYIESCVEEVLWYNEELKQSFLEHYKTDNYNKVLEKIKGDMVDYFDEFIA